MPILQSLRARPKAWVSAGLVAAGLSAGAVIGTTVSAGASTSPTSTTAASSAAGAPTTPSWSPSAGSPAAGLPKSGTVTAVGSGTVTIDGTTYAVTSSSDIDKNGEASLSSLKAGDKVTFSLEQAASTPTIDKLHAGSEALDRPSGPPAGGPSGGYAPAA
jgi:hypothetical protein